MKKRIIVVGITVLLAVTLLTAFCASAKPPAKVTLYGQTVGGGAASNAYHNLSIVPVQNNVFGVYSTTTYEVNTQMRFYFKTDFTSIESFTLSIEKLSSLISTNSSSSLASYTIQLLNMNSAGTVTAYTNIRANTQTAYLSSSAGNDVYSWRYLSTSVAQSYNSILVTVCFQSFIITDTPIYFQVLDFSVNGEETALSVTDQKLDEMMNYDSQGGSSDVEGASDMVDGIADDVNDITTTINQHIPAVSNWLSTSYVADDLMNIALLANSWLPAYLNCDPDVAFYWSLVTFCIVLCLIENGLRRRPWHGFSEGDDFESEYDVTSTDEKGRSRTIHNKVRGTRRRSR